MQEPIEFRLHKTIQEGDMKAALLLSEELVKRVLFSQWKSGEALVTERKARPQAAAGDVPLPLDDKPVIPRKPRTSKKLEEHRARREEGDADSLGKPFLSLKEMVNAEVAHALAMEAFQKNRNGKSPRNKTELAQFLGFQDSRSILPLFKKAKFGSHYAEYLSKILGPEILI